MGCNEEPLATSTWCLESRLREAVNYNMEPSQKSPTVFVDACWFQHGFQWKRTSKKVSAQWGDSLVTVDMPDAESLEFPEGVLKSEAPHLFTIADLSRAHRLRLITSELVMFETWGGSGNSRPSSPGHVFEDVAIERLKAPFEIVLVFDGTRRIREQLELQLNGYPEPELSRMTKTLGKRHLLDIVHLITASRLGADYFLCDRAFTKAYRSQRDTSKAWPVTPSELLRNLHRLP